MSIYLKDPIHNMSNITRNKSFLKNPPTPQKIGNLIFPLAENLIQGKAKH